MITRLVSAIVGLLAFAGCIVGGMLSGNEFDAIIVNAIKGLFFGCILGWIAGKCCEIIVNENFREMVHSDAAEEVERSQLAEGMELSPEEARLHAEETGLTSSGPDGAKDWEKVGSEEDVNKDGKENDREHLNVPDMQETFAARAAKELLGDVFKK